jgi:hypothetical protein
MKTLTACLTIGLLALAPSLLSAAENEIEATASAIDEEASVAGGPARVERRLAQSFGPLTGSEEDATRLIRGLRNGDPVMLDDSTTVTPPTGRLGYGETAIALSLAQESLTQAGITDPTSEQLQAALTGGSVTNANG